MYIKVSVEKQWTEMPHRVYDGKGISKATSTLKKKRKISIKGNGMKQTKMFNKIQQITSQKN